MTDERIILGTAAAVAVAAALWLAAENGGVLKLHTGIDVATSAAGWAPDCYGPAGAHLAQPRDMTATLHGRHPLFRRPGQLGGQRAAVVSAGGWRWFADPPAAEGL